jgi:cytochrome c2
VKTKLQTVGLAALAATMAAFLLTASGCQNSEAQTTAPATPATEAAAAPAKPSPLEHGKYLVENVGLCADCHTPRGPKGEPDMKLHLGGTMVGFAPIGKVPDWRPFAPKIAGMPSGWTRDHMIKFLETGEKPGGIVCGPPMPPYRFNHEDAIAVAEYLASLGKK